MKKDRNLDRRNSKVGSESPPPKNTEQPPVPEKSSTEDAGKGSKTNQKDQQAKHFMGAMALVKCPRLGNQPLFPESPYGPGVALANWARGKEGYRCVKCGDIHPLYGKI